MPYDKALHFLVGIFIACCSFYFKKPLKGFAISIALAFTLALAKEIRDHFTEGLFDVMDFAFTMYGNLIAGGLIYFLRKTLSK